MLKKRLAILTSVSVLGMLVFTSCEYKQSPGVEYMPDMYRSPAIEAYQPNGWFADSLGARKPVEGTIPRGFLSYEKFPDTEEGYAMAKANMTMPDSLKVDSAFIANGKAIYAIYCTHCHGEKGDGQGILVKREKFLGIPNYADRDITEGSIFHVVTYGRNLMGSHASQVTPLERWEVAQYVLKLRRELKGEEVPQEVEDKTAPADTVGSIIENAEVAQN